MESTNQLLQDINAVNSEPVIFNVDEINKELVKDAVVYKGLGIKLLSIAGGLLGAGFFMGFIFMIASGSEGTLAAAGIIAIAAAVYVDHKVRNTIMDAACIGTYLAGFAMFGHGAGHFIHTESVLPIIFMCIALITIVCTTGFMLTFISTLIITSCLIILININHAFQIIPFLTGILAILYTLSCIFEARLLTYSAQINVRYVPLRNGLLFSFVAMLFYLSIDMTPSGYLISEWISSVMIICTFLFVLNYLIGLLKITNTYTKLLIYSLSLIVLVPAIYAPAICGALLIMSVSFHIGHRTGLVIGCLCLLYFVGQYYYTLHYTLLQKSIIMFATGALFLTAWFVLKKQLKRYEQN